LANTCRWITNHIN